MKLTTQQQQLNKNYYFYLPSKLHEMSYIILLIKEAHLSTCNVGKYLTQGAKAMQSFN